MFSKASTGPMISTIQTPIPGFFGSMPPQTALVAHLQPGLTGLSLIRTQAVLESGLLF